MQVDCWCGCINVRKVTECQWSCDECPAGEFFVLENEDVEVVYSFILDDGGE
jgi:hypothetical protein